MKTVWTKGLSKEQALELRGDFKSSLVTRKRLIELLESKDKECDRSTKTKEGYDCPNWSFKQADSIGYRRALHEIMSLLDDSC